MADVLIPEKDNFLKIDRSLIESKFVIILKQFCKKVTGVNTRRIRIITCENLVVLNHFNWALVGLRFGKRAVR